jgi:hypothetical protein
LDAVKREQAGPSSIQGKENETDPVKPAEVTKDGMDGHENGEFVEQISAQENTRHSPHEQTVGA